VVKKFAVGGGGGWWLVVGGWSQLILVFSFGSTKLNNCRIKILQKRGGNATYGRHGALFARRSIILQLQC
jgi:hypothetical protein